MLSLPLFSVMTVADPEKSWQVGEQGMELCQFVVPLTAQ
jgi:hypothetical protein